MKNSFLLNILTKIKIHSLVLLGYFLIVLLFNLQLVLNINSHVVGNSFSDSFEVLWLLNWAKSSIFDLKTNPLYTEHVFYPHGWYLASSPQSVWYMLFFSVPVRFFGPVITYNILLLMTFIIAGFGVYLVVYHLIQNRFISFLSGCVFITAPFITLRLGGHLNILLGTQLIPYIILFVFRTFESSGKKRIFWIILSSITLALSILGSWYFLFINTILLVGLLWYKSDISLLKKASVLLAIYIFSIIIISPFIYLTFKANVDMFGRVTTFHLTDSDIFSLSIDRLFIPHVLHPIWGNIFGHIFPGRGEQDAVFLAYIAFFLAILGVLKTQISQTKPFVIMTITSLILSMGTTLYWNAKRVEIPLPYNMIWISEKFDLNDITPGFVPIPLPGILLYYFLPFYNALRVWARFYIIFLLATSILVGFGCYYMSKKIKYHNIIFFLFLVILLIEHLIVPYKNFTAVSVNERKNVNDWLKNQPESTSIIEYPKPYVDKIAMYSQSLHGKKVVNGDLYHMPTYLEHMHGKLGMWPGKEDIAILRDWGIDYILVNGIESKNSISPLNNFKEILPQIKSLCGLCYLRSYDEGFMIYYTETHIFRILQQGETCENKDRK